MRRATGADALLELTDAKEEEEDLRKLETRLTDPYVLENLCLGARDGTAAALEAAGRGPGWICTHFRWSDAERLEFRRDCEEDRAPCALYKALGWCPHRPSTACCRFSPSSCHRRRREGSIRTA